MLCIHVICNLQEMLSTLRVYYTDLSFLCGLLEIFSNKCKHFSVDGMNF